MAIAFINHKEAGGTANGVTTGAVDMTGANFLVLSVAYYSVGTLSSVTDSLGNVYTALTAEFIGGDLAVNLYYKASPTVGSAMTFTASGTGIYPAIVAMGFSGVHATPIDQEAAGGQVFPGTTVQPGSITPSENNTLLVTCVGFNGGTLSINSPYVNSVYQIAFSGGNNFGVAATYFVQGSAAAVNPTWTDSTAAFMAAHQASFKAAASTIISKLAGPRSSLAGPGGLAS